MNVYLIQQTAECTTVTEKNQIKNKNSVKLRKALKTRCSGSHECESNLVFKVLREYKKRLEDIKMIIYNSAHEMSRYRKLCMHIEPKPEFVRSGQKSKCEV